MKRVKLNEFPGFDLRETIVGDLGDVNIVVLRYPGEKPVSGIFFRCKYCGSLFGGTKPQSKGSDHVAISNEAYSLYLKIKESCAHYQCKCRKEDR